MSQHHVEGGGVALEMISLCINADGRARLCRAKEIAEECDRAIRNRARLSGYVPLLPREVLHMPSTRYTIWVSIT